MLKLNHARIPPSVFLDAIHGTLILAAIAQRDRLELVAGKAIVADATFTLRTNPRVEVLVWRR